MTDLSTKPVDDLTEQAADSELARLAKAIAEADIAYHQKDAPEITDAEDDAMRRRNDAIEEAFPNLVREDSPSMSVGAPPAEGFAKVRHAVPMLSLAKAYTDQDVVDFIERGRRFFQRDEGLEIAFTAEPKIDGLSASLRYENGIFVQGATRGDGAVGEDITANLRTIRDIPERLAGSGWPQSIEIRGEVYMTYAEFQALKERSAATGGQDYVNPRNTAGFAAPEGCFGHRQPQPQVLRLCLGPYQRRPRADPVRGGAEVQGLGFSGQPAHGARQIGG